MKLKQAILAVAGRDRLRQIVDGLELDGVDRRSLKAMRAALSHSRRASPALMLEYLSEREVKEVCEAVGLSSLGRRAALIQALLGDKRTAARTEEKADREPPEDGVRDDVTEAKSRAPRAAQLAATINVTRTELVWPGKYKEDGSRKEVPRVSLPFQVIERVNESRATREAKSEPQMSLFDVYEGKEGETFEEGWTNKLIWGDNLLVMGSLLEKFAGKVDLIYIDPPFATGADFSFEAEIGDRDVEVLKEQSAIEEKAYRDTWGRGLESYLQMLSPRLMLLRELLSSTGSIYVHVDHRVDSHVRLLLDELLGANRFRNEIVWHYRHMSNVRSDFARKHDLILRYSKTESYTFNIDDVREPYDEQTVSRYKKQVVFPGGYQAKMDPRGKIPDDVWVIPPIRNVSSENLGFPTQKPSELLRKIILASSDEENLVGDFFCGSGTTLDVAEQLGRRWIGCDLSR